MFNKLLLTFLLMPLMSIAQHTIKGKLSPAENYKWIILYKVSPTNNLYTADTKVNEDGSFSLELDSTVVKGMYRLVYALPQEQNYVDIIYNSEEDIEFNFDEEEGINYSNSRENKLLTSYENEMYSLRTEIGKRYQDGYTDVAPLFNTLETLQSEFEKEGEGSIALNFIKANRPYFPKRSEELDSYIKNTKAAYFKYIDFNNSVLQESNFLLESSYNYITGFIGKDEKAARENNIDVVYEKLKTSNAEFQKILLFKLWQRFVDMDQISTANYIAENYLIPLSKKLNDLELAEMLTTFKNLSIGSKAPNFNWEEENDEKTSMQSLHDIDNANNYIVVFWSSACSHCLKEVPKLHSKINEMAEGDYKVIAVGLEDEPYDWQNTIHDFPLFTNVLGLGKWENEIGNAYGINSTPTYFVLDKNKKIAAKPEDFDELLKLITEAK